MKKIITLTFLLLLLGSAAYCEDEASTGDEWSDIGEMQDAWDGQKIITDDMFEKVIKQRTQKANEKAEKKLKKKLGEPIDPNNSNTINTNTLKTMTQDYPTLLVPKTLIMEQAVIPTGFYRVLAAKNKKGEFYINFYQGNQLIGKLPALETDNDYGAETINYAKIIYTQNDTRAKVVYGCLDYNLVSETDTK